MRYVLIIYCLVIGTICQAQMFKTMFIVEDAMGNRDSVWLGFDTLANGQNNLQFGELDLNHPFDSVLDVRCSHMGTWSLEQDPFLSKTIIGHCEKYGNVDCYQSEGIPIFIKARYQPVTLYWDREYIYNYSPCQTSAYLTANLEPFLIGVWYLYELYLESPEDIRASCIAESDSYQINLDPAFPIPPIEVPFKLTPDQTGNSENIHGVMVFFSDGNINTPCSWLSSASAGTPDYAVKVSPNPVHSVLTVSSEDLPINSVQVINQVGQVVHESQVGGSISADIDLTHVPPGLYLAVVNGYDKRQRILKVLKL
jgi:Secretion system C-terminal sorting domain